MNLEEVLYQEYKMEAKNENINRQTAYIVSVQEIINSKYIKTEGEWTPNYLEIGNEKISRINIIGVVISVSEDQNLKTFVIDDGTGSIQSRIFDQEFKLDLEIGDIVMVIGKAREFNDDKYLVPEIVKNLKNEDWLEYRKKQLKNIKRTIIPKEKKEQKIEEELVSSDKESDGIFNLIRELDQGEGVYVEDIIKENPNAEKIIENLLNEGEIFEIKPGKIKLLE